MFKRNKSLKVIIAVLTAILILAYAFAVLLPHSHEFMEADCAVCAMIETSRSILIGIVLFASIHLLTKISVTVLGTYPEVLFVRDGTPVGLKVKLSD